MESKEQGLPNGTDLLAAERLSRQKGSGLTPEALGAEWHLDQLWGKQRTAPPMAPATDAPVDASVVSWIASTTPVPLMFAPGEVVAHPASASTAAMTTAIHRRMAYSPSAFR